MLSMSRKIVVSLFCGAGGLDLGFEAAGFEIAVAIDNNEKVLEIYQNNFPGTTVLCRDIFKLTAREIRETINNRYSDWDGEIAAVIGGPPCQGFSIAGKQDVNDERSKLVIKFIDLVTQLNPSIFVMENVPAIESKKFEDITGNATALIQERYMLSKWLLTASDYGVPQKRQRVIWVGSKFDVVSPPSLCNQRFTVGDAIADLAGIPINSEVDVWDLQVKGEYARLSEKTFLNPSAVAGNEINGCRATSHSIATINKYANTVPGTKELTTWAYRLFEKGFSPTLRAGSGNRTAARPIHYEQARVITVREAARLHSYPDWFDFGETKLNAHKAIGNSVPPLLAYAIAQAVMQHLECNIENKTYGGLFLLSNCLLLRDLYSASYHKKYFDSLLAIEEAKSNRTRKLRMVRLL